MRSRVTAILLWILACPVLALEPGAVAERAPAFALRSLGVLGGDVDTNLSCYLLGVPGESRYPLMIDGGSVVSGILRWKEETGELKPGARWSERSRVIKDTLRPVTAFLLTHPHLDHVGGFVQKSTLDFVLAMEGRPPLEVVGLPETTKAVGDLLFSPPLWVDFTRLPRDNPAIKLRTLDEGGRFEAGPFSIQVVRLHHTVACAAFLVSAGPALYAHLGDTGPTTAVWDVCRPRLGKGELRAISVEVSFPVEMESLAALSGHLTRNSLLLELNKLTRSVTAPPPASGMTEAQARALARRVAPDLRGVKVVATHLKALQYDEIVAELEILRQEGISLIVPLQGGLCLF